MQSRFLCVLTVCALVFSVSESSTACIQVDDFRTWKDATGKFAIQAQLIQDANGTVTLKKENGDEINLPVNKLSAAYRKFLVKVSREDKPSDTNGSTKTDVKDWPTWRGTDRTGVSKETGLMQKWPESGPPLQWTVDGIGGGYSSVSVADGNIYTLSQMDGSQQIVCISIEGNVKWKTPISKNGQPNCTPTIDDGLVYAIGRHGTLAAVKAENGEKVWSVDFASDFGGKMMSQWGFSESPLVDGEKLICTPGGPTAMIVALNKKTGKLIWKTPMQPGGSKGQDGAGYSSVVIGNMGGVRQYITLVGRGVISVDAATGRPLWQYEKVANGTANVPTPIVSGNYVFCSSGYGDGGSALLQIQKKGRNFSAREVYHYEAREVQNHHGGMVLIDGFIYMGHGHNKGLPMCLEMRTGKIKWGGKIRGEGDGSAAIVAADGQIYFRYENGKMALVEANPMSYKVNGAFTLPSRNGKSWPHPVISDGRLYIRDQHQLHCFDIK